MTRPPVEGLPPFELPPELRNPAPRTPGKPGRPGLSAPHWLHAGHYVLASDGVAGLRIKHIGQLIGVGQGSFYGFFDSLDDFVSQLMDEVQAHERTWVEDAYRALDGGSDPVEVVIDFASSRTTDVLHAAEVLEVLSAREGDTLAAHAVAIHAMNLGLYHEALVAAGLPRDEVQARATALHCAMTGYWTLEPGHRQGRFWLEDDVRRTYTEVTVRSLFDLPRAPR